MSDAQGNHAAVPPAGAPVFQLQRMYLKDASLEMPHAPQIFLESQAPQVEVQLDVVNDVVAEGIREVQVRTTVTARVGDRVLFLVEAKQAGIFEIRNLPEDQLDPILGIVCPNVVYPYLRANVADLVTRAGLPPVHLAEINFEVLYHQRRAQAGQQAAQAGQAAPSVTQ